MPRVQVRKAIAQYLRSANVEYLGKVYEHPPKYTSEGEFVLEDYAGQGTGAVIYLHLVEQSEERVALGGAQGGQKQRTYNCGLICVLRSKKPSTEDVGHENDEFLDSLVLAIQADRTANSSVIFQWGEGDTLEGQDIVVRAEMPRPIRQQASQVFSTVEVKVMEMIPQTGG